jgi:hypothetical protein
MKTIYKYPIFAADESIEMPAGAQILCVQAQGPRIQIWAVVDVDASRVENRRFEVYATGQVIDIKNISYIGTVQINGGLTVFHVFEVITKEAH